MIILLEFDVETSTPSSNPLPRRRSCSVKAEMTLRLSSRRVMSCVTSIANPKAPHTLLIKGHQQRTAFFGKGWHRVEDIQPKPISPLTEEYLTKKPKQTDLLVQGDLAPSSIFEDEEVAGSSAERAGANTERASKKLTRRNPANLAAVVDPKPASRRMWERKMVIRQIRKRGRLTKTQLLKRQERQFLLKSHDFKTSVKKLVPLAKQIAGKTIDDAIIQMRFSKKKVAKDVREHLEHVKNEAIVRRGMGQGFKTGEKPTPMEIIKKDGKRMKVTDPTAIYVDQAWCGKGLYGTSPDYRARGQMHIMKNRTTSISIVLKEEKTRIRLHNEREAKERRKKVWVQLPNRPITAQRQFYSW